MSLEHPTFESNREAAQTSPHLPKPMRTGRGWPRGGHATGRGFLLGSCLPPGCRPALRDFLLARRSPGGFPHAPGLAPRSLHSPRHHFLLPTLGGFLFFRTLLRQTVTPFPHHAGISRREVQRTDGIINKLSEKHYNRISCPGEAHP